MKIKSRPCRIGASINTRTEIHGEDPVPMMDVPLVNLLLDAAELDELLGPSSHVSLFANITPPMPQWHEKLKPLQLVGKWKKSKISLSLPVGSDIDLAGVTFAKLKLEPQIGGLTALSLTVQMGVMSVLLNYLDQPIVAQLELGEATAETTEDEPELPLEHTEGNVTRITVDHETKKRGRPRKDTNGTTKHAGA